MNRSQSPTNTFLSLPLASAPQWLVDLMAKHGEKISPHATVELSLRWIPHIILDEDGQLAPDPEDENDTTYGLEFFVMTYEKKTWTHHQVWVLPIKEVRALVDDDSEIFEYVRLPHESDDSQPDDLSKEHKDAFYAFISENERKGPVQS